MSLSIRRVLISEKVDSACVKILENAGIQVDLKPGMPIDQLKKELKNYNALVVRSATKVTADVIAAGAGTLQVIGRAGTGVDNIDCNAATRHGVLVINAPGGNTLSAAELTCGMILAVSRSIPQGCSSLKSGKWDRSSFMGQEVLDKTLAIIGLGRIGREVAARMQSFGMKTIGFDPLVPADVSREFGVESLSLEEIWPKADFITVHTPLIPQTKNLLNDKSFGQCKKGVCVVNCARGGIIDEDALVRALESGQCGGAALDVFQSEPPTNLALTQHPKVICTPHLGASTKEAQIRVAEEIAEQFVELNKGKSIWGSVNAPTLQAMLATENQPWINACESLAKLANALLGSTSLTKVLLVTKGKSLETKGRLLTNSITVGLLKGQGQEANFISAPALSGDIGIQVEHKHDSTSSEILLELTAANKDGKSVTLQGAVQGESTLLYKIDQVAFNPPAQISGQVLIGPLASSEDSTIQLISTLAKEGIQLNCLALSGVLNGQQWCIANLQGIAGLPSSLADNWAFATL